MRTTGTANPIHWTIRILAACLAVGLILSMAMPAAVAQERTERRTLFHMLFGEKPRRYVDEDPIQRPRDVTKPRVRKRKSQSVTAITTKPAPVQKAEDARKILVVGDFLANGLGEGMKTAFETLPTITVESRTNVASGLVRDDYYDWQTQLSAAIDEVKPAIVVILLGANDRQQMVVGDGKEKFRTDAWLQQYEARTLALARNVTARGIPLLWVGLPAFQSTAMSTDAVQLNGIYRAQTEKAGGEFVDVWDGFVDENGKFVVTGSDVNGQPVRLRGADGLNLTKAGQRKIAFYLEKPVKRLLGDATAIDSIKLDASNLPELINLPPSETNRMVRTLPISLSDPDLDGGTELLGANTISAIINQSPRNLLVEKGEMAPAPAGRVDDYRMPMAKPIK